MPLPVEVSWGTTQAQFRAVVRAVERELVGYLASRPQTQLPGPVAKRSLQRSSLADVSTAIISQGQRFEDYALWTRVNSKPGLASVGSKVTI